MHFSFNEQLAYRWARADAAQTTPFSGGGVVRHPGPFGQVLPAMQVTSQRREAAGPFWSNRPLAAPRRGHLDFEKRCAFVPAHGLRYECLSRPCLINPPASRSEENTDARLAWT